MDRVCGWGTSILAYCRHVDLGGLGLPQADPSLLVQEGGVHIAETTEHLSGSGTDWNAWGVWEGGRGGEGMK